MTFLTTFITDVLYPPSFDSGDVSHTMLRLLSTYTDEVKQLEFKQLRGKSRYSAWSGLIRTQKRSPHKAINELTDALRDATPVPFRITFMSESGPVVTHSIEPRDPPKKRRGSRATRTSSL